jgi:hypothetical protein
MYRFEQVESQYQSWVVPKSGVGVLFHLISVDQTQRPGYQVLMAEFARLLARDLTEFLPTLPGRKGQQILCPTGKERLAHLLDVKMLFLLWMETMLLVHGAELIVSRDTLPKVPSKLPWLS